MYTLPKEHVNSKDYYSQWECETHVTYWLTDVENRQYWAKEYKEIERDWKDYLSKHCDDGIKFPKWFKLPAKQQLIKMREYTNMVDLFLDTNGFGQMILVIIE